MIIDEESGLVPTRPRLGAAQYGMLTMLVFHLAVSVGTIVILTYHTSSDCPSWI